MKTASKNPIIFLPGLMGSMGGEMIQGLGTWSFGIAKWVYEPLIDGLENIGYRRDQNLFICYYDWRKGIEEIVEEYLIPIVDKARKKFPHQTIDILCHSMGGIVARQYLQGDSYKGNVERLVMMGTPNRGSIDAYYLWSTGTLVPARKKTLLKILYRGYIWMLTKMLHIPIGSKDIEKLHQHFRGLADLIPSNNYGDFLCIEEEHEEWIRIPRRYMKYNNHKLDKLNNDMQRLKNAVKEIHCFAGMGYETNHLLVLNREQLMKYNQEVIQDVLTTIRGDNSVTLESASIDGFHNTIIPTTHRGIVKGCLPYITRLYGVNIEEVETSTNEELEETLHIIFKGDIEFSLELENKSFMSYEGKRVITVNEYLKEDYINSFSWVGIKNVPKGLYSLKLSSAVTQNVSILVMSTSVEEEYSDEISYLKNQPIIQFKIE